MVDIPDEMNEPPVGLPPISAYIWSPWYAKLYWSLTPSLWLVGSDWVQGLPEAVAKALAIAAIFTAPPIVFLVLAFGWLEKFIHDPNRVWAPMAGHRADRYFWDEYNRRREETAIIMNRYDPRSPNYYMNDVSNPLNPHHQHFFKR
ncbi:hypothetical protein SAMN05518668_109191 [Sphingobium sp. YR657]|uniref:hypothetical protein n=1 Tax=Sphingobium sp. YR657 TaxID=1884366 RepID=UPI0009215316|nr:hypothetical protein [Sphingobium sp. YR657]SHM45204.1 hypothetical protein SAMN05518668_109191 [Sphingobium sp. YR657]